VRSENMFESLDPLERTVNRRRPLLMYSMYAVVSLLFLIPEVRRMVFRNRSGLSSWPPRSCYLDLLVATLRSVVPPTRREVRVRYIILLLPMWIFGTGRATGADVHRNFSSAATAI